MTWVDVTEANARQVNSTLTVPRNAFVVKQFINSNNKACPFDLLVLKGSGSYMSKLKKHLAGVHNYDLDSQAYIVS